MSADQTHAPDDAVADAAVDRGDDSVFLDADSDEEPVLSVVMPTLNEEEGVRTCLEWIEEAVRELGLATEVVVSDSSDDRTPEIAAEHGAIVVEPEGKGYGNAYKGAFDHVRGDYVAIGDADTTYDFRELPKLVDLAFREDVDMAIGSRLNGEIEAGAMPPLHQYVGNPLLTRFLNAFYDAGVSDAHSGMRVLSAEALEELDLDSDGMEFASEMIMAAAARDMTIEELPITYRERVGEATLDSFQDGWRHVKFMLVNAPGRFFSVPGVAMAVLGLLTMALSLAGVEVAGVSFAEHTMVGGSLLALLGYQVGQLALFSSVGTDPIQQPDDPLTDWVRQHFRLEQGATAGVLVALAGFAALALFVGRWAVAGAGAFPSPAATLLAATVVLVGVQTVFSSFFLSMLADAST